MPILRFHAIDLKPIAEQSELLVADLSETLACSPELITLEVIHSTFITGGKVVEGYPVVEVSWFDRGQAVQDAAAACITKHVRAMGHPEVDVIFAPLAKTGYYENGEHF